MNKKILIGLCIFLLAISPVYAWDDENYEYRMPINTSGATLTDYQLGFNFTKPANMAQNDFDDMRFYSFGGVERPYWIESKSDGNWAYVWLKGNFTTSDADIDNYVYYGNDAVETTSNGTNTFEEFFDKDSTAGWNILGGMSIATSGNYLRFYGPNRAGYDYATRFDLSLPTHYISEMKYHTTSLGGQDCTSILHLQTDTLNRKTHMALLYPTNQNNWIYYVASTQYTGGAFGEGTEYIFKWDNDDANAATGGNMYLMNTAREVLSSATGKATALGTITATDGLWVGNGASTGDTDLYIEWFIFRKYAATEPTLEFGAEENQAGNPPSIMINNPTNTTYYTTQIPINVTVSDSDSASFWCAIYNDGALVTNQTTNTTYTTTLTKTGGSHNVSVNCEDVDTATSSDAEYYYVFMGLNVSAFNGGNASALTSWNIYATNGTFNYSDTGLSNPTLIDVFDLPTGTVNISFEKTGFANATYTRTLNNSAFVQLDANLFYYQYFYAKDVDTSASLSNFTIDFDNGTATASGTADGTNIYFPLNELPYGTVNVTVGRVGYNSNSTQIEINGSSQIAYTTYLKKAGLYLTAKDEETYSALTFNITISNSTTSQSWTGQTTFSKEHTEIPNGYITITIKSTDYSQRIYFGTMTQYTALTFSAYLLKDVTGHDTAIIILNQNDIPMQTATVTATKFINGAWVTIEQGETDSSGTVSLFLNQYTQYKIKIEHGDIVTFYRTLTPSANSYTFRVSGQIELNFFNLFEGVSYSITPVQNSILTEQINLTYTISSATGELEYFGYVVEDTDHNEIATGLVDSSPSGAEMIYALDLTTLNYTIGDNIYFYTYFKRADTDEATYSRYYVNKTYVIWIYADSNSTIIDALDQFSSENSGELVLLLLSTLIMALSLGGLGVMIQRVDVALLVVLFEMGIFTMIGWIPFFAGSVAGLLGIIILFGYVRGS